MLLDPTLAAKDAIMQHLDMPTPHSDGRYNTLNERGAMSPNISALEEKFIEIARQPNSKVVEIGTAYGKVCLKALEQGANHYVANDVDLKHLQILARRVFEQMPTKLDTALTLVIGSFPDTELLAALQPDQSYDAILASNVLHFLTEPEVRIAFTALRRLLKPGGKLFASMITPYFGFFKAEMRAEISRQVNEFIGSNNKDKLAIPGYVADVRAVIDLEKVAEHEMDAIAITKEHNFLFDKDVVEYLLHRDQFQVDTCEYICSPDYPWHFDGREMLVMIAQKPTE